MTLIADPWQELGRTYTGTDQNGNLCNEEKLGTKHTFYTPASSSSIRGGKTPVGKGAQITAILMRNTAGFALLPKRLGHVSVVAGYAGLNEVDGYMTVLGSGPHVVIDPYLPTAGVPDDDLFWAIVGGPVECLTPMAGADQGSDIAVGNHLIASTGTTTGATTSGRVAKITIANATDATGAVAQIPGIFGRALSARTTAETNSAILVQIHNRWF